MRSPVARLVFLVLALGHNAVSLAACAAVPETVNEGEAAAFAKIVRPEDSIWLVSTRHLGSTSCLDDQPWELQVLRFGETQGWQAAKTEELRSENTRQPLTVIYVHGNRERLGSSRATRSLDLRGPPQGGRESPAVPICNLVLAQR